MTMAIASTRNRSHPRPELGAGAAGSNGPRSPRLSIVISGPEGIANAPTTPATTSTALPTEMALRLREPDVTSTRSLKGPSHGSNALARPSASSSWYVDDARLGWRTHGLTWPRSRE
jgi:hypothetical protein